MELTKEETRKVEERQLQQHILTQHFLQMQQLILSQQTADYQMYQLQLDFMNQLWIDIWCTFGITSDILSQKNLPCVPPITDDEKKYIHRLFAGDEYALQRLKEEADGKMPAQLNRLRCALDESKAVWPNWLTVILKILSASLMMEMHKQRRNKYIP